MAYIGYGLMWLSVALAVCVGLYYTHNIHCLWFLFVPTLISFRIEDKNKDS